MSSNRLKFDSCAYSKLIQESTQPLEYKLYKGKYLLDTKCPVGDFPNELDFASRADMENELYGLNRLGTRCPEFKYHPNSNFKIANLSPARMCENIYYITPSNIQKPTTTMIAS